MLFFCNSPVSPYRFLTQDYGLHIRGADLILGPPLASGAFSTVLRAAVRGEPRPVVLKRFELLSASSSSSSSSAPAPALGSEAIAVPPLDSCLRNGSPANAAAAAATATAAAASAAAAAAGLRENISSILAELTAAARLRHPHITPLLGMVLELPCAPDDDAAAPPAGSGPPAQPAGPPLVGLVFELSPLGSVADHLFPGCGGPPGPAAGRQQPPLLGRWGCRLSVARQVVGVPSQGTRPHSPYRSRR